MRETPPPVLLPHTRTQPQVVALTPSHSTCLQCTLWPCCLLLLLLLVRQVLELEEAKGEWGFKALKQIMKLHFRLVRTHPHCATPHPPMTTCLSCCQGNYEAMVACYRQLLTYIKGAVTRNYSEKSINSILDYISTSSNVSTQPSLHSAHDTPAPSPSPLPFPSPPLPSPPLPSPLPSPPLPSPLPLPSPPLPLSSPPPLLPSPSPPLPSPPLPSPPLPSPPLQFKLLEELYSTTLETLRETRNERLWFKTNTKVDRLPWRQVGWSLSNCLPTSLCSWESCTLTVVTLCVWRQ